MSPFMIKKKHFVCCNVVNYFLLYTLLKLYLHQTKIVCYVPNIPLCVKTDKELSPIHLNIAK